MIKETWIAKNQRNQMLDRRTDHIFVFFCLFPSGGGALVFEVGYHPRKKIHVIRVVFQMITRTSFRGAKTCKIGKKGLFWSF